MITTGRDCGSAEWINPYLQPLAGYEGEEFFCLVEVDALFANGFGLLYQTDGVMSDRQIRRRYFNLEE